MATKKKGAAKAGGVNRNAKGERTCHPECKGRPYCVPKHAKLCKEWHLARKKEREAKNRKERERRATKKKAAAPAASQGNAGAQASA